MKTTLKNVLIVVASLVSLIAAWFLRLDGYYCETPLMAFLARALLFALASTGLYFATKLKGWWICLALVAYASLALLGWDLVFMYERQSDNPLKTAYPLGKSTVVTYQGEASVDEPFVRVYKKEPVFPGIVREKYFSMITNSSTVVPKYVQTGGKTLLYLTVMRSVSSLKPQTWIFEDKVK